MTVSQPVVLFPTCVVDALAADVGVAVVRVLRRAGYEVALAEEATCCGQPAWNSGFADEAAAVASNTLDALEAVPDGTPICVPAGSCPRVPAFTTGKRKSKTKNRTSRSPPI